MLLTIRNNPSTHQKESEKLALKFRLKYLRNSLKMSNFAIWKISAQNYTDAQNLRSNTAPNLPQMPPGGN